MIQSKFGSNGHNAGKSCRSAVHGECLRLAAVRKAYSLRLYAAMNVHNASTTQPCYRTVSLGPPKVTHTCVVNAPAPGVLSWGGGGITPLRVRLHFAGWCFMGRRTLRNFWAESPGRAMHRRMFYRRAWRMLRIFATLLAPVRFAFWGHFWGT